MLICVLFKFLSFSHSLISTRCLLVVVIGPSGVIVRVFSKSDKREARGRFETMGTITPLKILQITNFSTKKNSIPEQNGHF